MYAARACLRLALRVPAGTGGPLHLWRALATASSRLPFLLADIGEGIAEVEVMQWHVKKGDTVKQFQPLVEVQSDKATVEITSRYDGIVDELRYDEGDIAKVGQPLCFIVSHQAVVETGEDNGESEEQNAASEPEDAKEGTDVTEEEAEAGTVPLPVGKPLATPAVRRIAKELGVILAEVSGSGPDGRITEEDVRLHAQSQEASSAVAADNGTQSPMTTTTLDIAGLPDAVRTEPVRGLRRVMARSMTAAKSVPHLGLGEEICVDKLLLMKQDFKRLSLESGTSRISLMPFFIKAASLALFQFPVLNASVSADCEHLHYHTSHNISVAMDTVAGLAVPNIKGVQSLSLVEIAAELERLAECARSGKFDKCDFENGTFTLSNIGSIGGTYTAPVVMVPQVAIGAIGKCREVPRISGDGEIVKSSILNVTWAADHRVVDGATMAKFSNAWKDFIEHPERMLLYLK